jgi:signal transduction histidine kinase
MESTYQFAVARVNDKISAGCLITADPLHTRTPRSLCRFIAAHRVMCEDLAMMPTLVQLMHRFDPVRSVSAGLSWASRPCGDTGVTWSIGKKIGLGLTLIIGSGLAAMTVFYRSADRTAAALRLVGEKGHPVSAAAYELEINAIGTGLGVMKYMQTPLPEHRERVERDEREFARFKTQHDAFAATQREKLLADKIAALYGQFISLGKGLMRQKDEADALARTFTAEFQSIDDSIEEKIQAGTEDNEQKSFRRLLLAARFAADLAEVGNWLGTYLEIPSADNEQRIHREFRESARRVGFFLRSGVSQEERLWGEDLVRRINELRSLAVKRIALDKQMRADVERFGQYREQLDELLDESLRVLAQSQMVRLIGEAEGRSAKTVTLAYLLIPIFLLVSIGAGWWIVRHISVSIAELRTGTEMVAGGDLGYRIGGRGQDELGLLARRFNQMVAQLEATTVSKEELEKAHHVLSKRTDDLARSNVELDQFASVVSHDLQEPLRMVTAYVQLLQTQCGGKLDKDADEFIGFAVDGAKRMQGLIDDLLVYSRVGTRGKEFTATDCNVVLARTLLNLKTAIDESGAQVTQDQLPTVPGDEFQLGQLLQNLIGNAIKYRGQRPAEIRVECERDGEMWRFAVTDNGIGIDPEYTERIFVIFQRLHTRQEYPGTGIGLAICKKIVERHRGKIWVESEPGKGSTFYFTLPIKQDGGPANVGS